MGAIHRIGNIKIQYVRVVDRIKVIPENGTTYWTNSFKIIRKEVGKGKERQLSLFQGSNKEFLGANS